MPCSHAQRNDQKGTAPSHSLTLLQTTPHSPHHMTPVQEEVAGNTWNWWWPKNLLHPPGPAVFFISLSWSLCGEVQPGWCPHSCGPNPQLTKQNSVGKVAPQIPDVPLTNKLLSIQPLMLLQEGGSHEIQAPSCHLAPRSQGWSLVRTCFLFYQMVGGQERIDHSTHVTHKT